ncbi:hypothetical protein K7I13_05970 [Brucepastera parasyntrophica]|uniref:hypothetical protein n=1 Tax=Brucepastera parasyntrophica TaxID=2880008 RepID=UPI00210D570D|nr:hypothetical protein [Brucepastera parasyntrophica]ULQ60810.1 hypothetical protein K7I13_05970 [Brucepastera parasyntrophica]
MTSKQTGFRPGIIPAQSIRLFLGIPLDRQKARALLSYHIGEVESCIRSAHDETYNIIAELKPYTGNRRVEG